MYLSRPNLLSGLTINCVSLKIKYIPLSAVQTGVKELAGLAFVSEASNILLLGPPGVGKTHLAVALALRAIENGQGAYFVRAYDLMRT